MKKIFFITILFFAGLVFSAPVYGATEFTAIVDTGNGADTDYTSLASWETGVQTDLSAATTQVFSGTRTSTIADNATVYLCRGGSYQSHSGTVVHSTAGQILIDAITGSATETSGDIWYTANTCDSANYFTISDGGDSAIAVAKCRTSDGSADTNYSYIDGWTTSATNYIKIWTDPNENYRHSGVWDETKYRLDYISGSGNTSPLEIFENHVRIDGLQVKETASSIYNHSVIYGQGQENGVSAEIQISNNIVTANQTGSGLEHGIMIQSSYPIMKFFNNVVYNCAYDGISLSSANSYVYNNTVYNNGQGIAGTGSWSYAKNNIAYNNVDNYSGTFSASSTNNLSGPGSDADIPATNARNGVIVQFADEANNDFHLDSADTGAKNQGIKLYNSSDDANLNFTADIDGDTRLDSAGTWDIGADENVAKIYRSVGPSATGALATGGASNYGNLEIKPTYLPGSTTRITDYVATFWRPLPDNVGVGDAVQYDADDNGSIDHVVFITKRWDSAHFSVRTSTGTSPVATIAPDADFGVYRSYISLSNAEAGEENDALSDTVEAFESWDNGKDLVAGQEQWNIACYANGTTADVAGMYIQGWTTATSNYIKIYTPTRSDEVGTSQRHGGVWDTSKYHIVVDSNTFDVRENYVSIDGLQFANSNPTFANMHVFLASVDPANHIIISNNIIKGHGNNTYSQTLLPLSDSDLNADVYNNILYCDNLNSTKGIDVQDTNLVRVYNNTILGCDIGIRAISGLARAINNIAYDNNIDYAGANFSSVSTNNLSKDATAPGLNARRNQTVSFVSTSTKDFHLAPGDTGARNFGADLTNDLYFPINSDVDSAAIASGAMNCEKTDETCLTRPGLRQGYGGALWDIGADEVITKIYRSVAPDNDADNSIAALATGGSNSMTVDATTSLATFTTALPDNVGVGDVLQYDSNGSNSIGAGDTLAFISGRTDSMHYTVRTASGIAPVARSGDTYWSIFRAYTKLYNAKAGIENTAINSNLVNFDSWSNGKDIAASSEQWNIACYANGATADTTPFTMNNWTTAPQNYLKMYTPYLSSEVGTSQRHQGKWDTSKYRMDISGYYIIYNETDYWRIDGLQVKLTSTGNSWPGGIVLHNSALKSDVRVANNIIQADLAGLTNAGNGIGASFEHQGGVQIWNNIIYGWLSPSGGTSGGIHCGAYSTGQTWQVYNNTVYGCGQGITSYYLTFIARNNIAYNNGLDYKNSSGYDSRSTNNLSKDASAPAYGAYYRNATVAFVDEANGDFHLAPTDTGARGFGKDLSKDRFFPMKTDVDGQNRQATLLGAQSQASFSAPDIGADQSATPIYRSVAPSLTTALDTGSADANNLTISGTTMTVGTATPDNVGVGDVVQYDSDGNNSIDAIAFITGRTSSSQYSVQNREGGIPVAVTNDQNWSIFRAYTSLSDAIGYYGGHGYENTGISSNVRQFDIDWSESVERGKNIYAANQQWNVAAYANGTTSETGGASIMGWTTYPTDYIRIYTPYLSSEVGTSQRHQGKWDGSKYKLDLASYQGIYTTANYMRIDGIQLKLTSNDGNYPTGISVSVASQDSDIMISNNILWGEFGSLSHAATGIYNAGYYRSSNNRIWNNILYGWKGSMDSDYGIFLYSNNPAVSTQVYNNTIYDCEYGLYRNSGVAIAKNNLAYNNSVSDYSGTFDSSSTNNLSKDATAPAFNAYYRNATVNFADVANKDFHLASNDTSARNMGANLTSDVYLPLTSDVDGNARNVSSHTGAFDIGADEGATPIYYSVGQNVSDHKTGTPTVTIASGVATFSVAQTASNMGVGDKVTYNTSDVAYITGKTTTSIWTVETVTGTVPANITDSPVVSIAHAFASLEGAVDANTASGAFDVTHLNTKDLYVNNYQLNIPCYYDTGPDTTAVTVQGWTTAASNYIRIYTPNNITNEVNVSQRHGGKWDDLKYNRTADIRINSGSVQIDGLQLYVAGDVDVIRSANTDNNATVSISNNIIKNDYTSGSMGVSVITASVVGLVVKVWNNIIYGFETTNNQTRGIYSNGVGIVYVDNNTVIGGYYAYCSAGNLFIKNNIAQAAYDGFFAGTGDYNISDLPNDAPSASYRNNLATTVTFTDATNKDFHLAQTDTAAKNFGADLSADSNFAFNVDIDGNTRLRPGSGVALWDIGADEAATPVYYSVGQDGVTDRKVAGNISINSAGLATFINPQTGNIGVGDVIDYDSDNKKAYIVSKVDQSNWYVQTNTGALPATATNVTVNSIKRVFSSLSSAEAGATGATLLNTPDLFTNNYQLNFPCYYDTGADTTAVTVDGYTTALTNYIKIYTPNNTTSEANTSQRHSGKWDDLKFRMEYENGTNQIIYVNNNHVKIDGFQLARKNVSSGLCRGLNFNGEGVVVSNSIVKAESITTTAMGVGITGSGSNNYIFNNIVYGFNNLSMSGGISLGNFGYVYNNTVYNCGYGFDRYGLPVPIAKNNLFYNNGTDYGSGSSYDSRSTNNLSKDATAPAYNAYYRNATVQFVNEANKDFHLAVADTSARDKGADLSADANLKIISDIDGQNRLTGAGVVDIGADETATAAYFSVGQNTSDHKTGTAPTVSIASGVATFSEPQTATNMGIGDAVTYNTNVVAYITGKTTTSIWTVRTATGTLPADITGSAVVSITHAFASLEGAIDANTASGAFDATHLNTKDLFTNNYQLNVPCYYDTGPDTTIAQIQSWTTAPDNYIWIYTPVSTTSEVNQTQRHNGKWDDTKYQMVLAPEGSSELNINVNYARINGLQFKNNAAFNNNTGCITKNATAGYSTTYISNNIVWGNATQTNGGYLGIMISGVNNAASYVWNNIVYGFNLNNAGRGIFLGGWNNPNKIHYVYNNTVYGCYNGISTEDNLGQVIEKNNLSYNNASVDYSINGTASASSTNNLSKDATAPNVNVYYRNATVNFVDVANRDFHLANNDIGAKNMGTYLGADPYLPFMTDIDGESRPSDQTKWDIGADENENALIEFKQNVELKGGVEFKVP